MSRTARAVRFLVWAAAAVVLFAGVATLRAVLDGERELRQSDVAFDSNELHGAIEHARRARTRPARRTWSAATNASWPLRGGRKRAEGRSLPCWHTRLSARQSWRARPSSSPFQRVW